MHLQQHYGTSLGAPQTLVSLEKQRPLHLGIQSTCPSARRATRFRRLRRYYRGAQLSDEVERVRQVCGTCCCFWAPEHRSLHWCDYRAQPLPRQETSHRSCGRCICGHALLHPPLPRDVAAVLTKPDEHLGGVLGRRIQRVPLSEACKANKRAEAFQPIEGREGRCGARPGRSNRVWGVSHEVRLSAAFRKEQSIDIGDSP